MGGDAEDHVACEQHALLDLREKDVEAVIGVPVDKHLFAIVGAVETGGLCVVVDKLNEEVNEDCVWLHQNHVIFIVSVDAGNKKAQEALDDSFWHRQTVFMARLSCSHMLHWCALSHLQTFDSCILHI